MGESKIEIRSFSISYSKGKAVLNCHQETQLLQKLSELSFNPTPPGLFGVPGPGVGGGLQKPPPTLHKSESIDPIVMKLGG